MGKVSATQLARSGASARRKFRSGAFMQAMHAISTASGRVMRGTPNPRSGRPGLQQVSLGKEHHPNEKLKKLANKRGR